MAVTKAVSIPTGVNDFREYALYTSAEIAGTAMYGFMVLLRLGGVASGLTGSGVASQASASEPLALALRGLSLTDVSSLFPSTSLLRYHLRSPMILSAVPTLASSVASLRARKFRSSTPQRASAVPRVVFERLDEGREHVGRGRSA